MKNTFYFSMWFLLLSSIVFAMDNNKPSNVTSFDKLGHGHEIVVQVFGSKGSGKSALMRRFADNKFDNHGLDINVECQCKTMRIGGVEYKAKVWEAHPGEMCDIYKYIRNAKLIFLTIDLSESEEKVVKDLKLYMERLSRRDGNSILTIVGTKSDLVSDPHTKLEHILKIAQLSDFNHGYISSKTSDHVCVCEVFGRAIRIYLELQGIVTKSTSEMTEEEQARYLRLLRNEPSKTGGQLQDYTRLLEEEVSLMQSVMSIMQSLMLISWEDYLSMAHATS